MKSFEKTNSSVKELWEIVDGFADNGSEPIKKPQEAKKVNSFNC